MLAMTHSLLCEIALVIRFHGCGGLVANAAQVVVAIANACLFLESRDGHVYSSTKLAD